MRTLDITNPNNWTNEIRTDLTETQLQNAVTPTNTETGRKSGIYYYNIYNKYTTPKTTTNKTFIFKITTTGPGNFIVGFINTSNHENTPIFSHNNLQSTTAGEHTIIWVIGNNGIRNIYYDNTLIVNTGSFSGNSSDEYAPMISSWGSEFILNSLQVFDYALSPHEITGGGILCTTDVTNGSSTLTFDTTNIGTGKHIIKARYNSNALYNEAILRSKLTIQ